MDNSCASATQCDSFLPYTETVARTKRDISGDSNAMTPVGVYRAQFRLASPRTATMTPRWLLLISG